MGIPLTAAMVFLLTITLVFLFTIAMVFLFTISRQRRYSQVEICERHLQYS